MHLIFAIFVEIAKFAKISCPTVHKLRIVPFNIHFTEIIYYNNTIICMVLDERDHTFDILDCQAVLPWSFLLRHKRITPIGLVVALHPVKLVPADTEIFFFFKTRATL